jgi:hypothetical protein
MYSIVNKLNCAFAISSFARYLSNLKDVQIQVFKHIMRYIKGTLSYGIKYQNFENGQILHGYSNAIGPKTKMFYILHWAIVLCLLKE